MIHETVKRTGRLQKKQLFQVAIFIVIFGIFVAGVSAVMNQYFNPETNIYIRQLVSHQNIALLVYLAYIILASVIVPLPTLPIDVIMLKLIDPWTVILIRLMGDLGGSTIGFFLARQFGRPLLKKWFSKKNYKLIESIAESISWKHFFIISMIPIINTELMAYAGGISKLRYRWVMFALAIAVFYRLLFVYFVIKA